MVYIAEFSLRVFASGRRCLRDNWVKLALGHLTGEIFSSFTQVDVNVDGVNVDGAKLGF